MHTGRLARLTPEQKWGRLPAVGSCATGQGQRRTQMAVSSAKLLLLTVPGVRLAIHLSTSHEDKMTLPR